MKRRGSERDRLPGACKKVASFRRWASPPGESRCLLAETEIAKTDILKRLKPSTQPGVAGEEVEPLLDREL